jgi:hypothetical protein|nr:MAG TPA: Ferritin light chain Light Chain Perdeuterated, METAL [Caudoviricetes sp.]
MMLIAEETIEKINLLIQAMFNHNRTLDRFLGWADSQWSFVTFSKVFHEKYAHLMPLLADQFADILLRYNIAPKYYETKRDVREYNSMIDFFNVNLNEHIETYELIKSAIDTATINGDLNVESDLKRLLRIWNKFMSQAILLRDKAEIYKDNLAMFDGFAEQFYILQDEYNLLNGIQND